MSKYGSGVSMKNMMLMEMEDVTKILDKYNMTAEDKKAITDALKEAFFQWASTNARFCQYEELFKQAYGEKAMMKIFKLLIISEPYFAQKMNETYPEEWSEDVLPKTGDERRKGETK